MEEDDNVESSLKGLTASLNYILFFHYLFESFEHVKDKT